MWSRALSRPCISFSTRNLSPLSVPRVIANAISGRPLGILQRHGYSGQIYAVNPNRETVGGLPAYKDVAAIPGQVDLALIAVPARLVRRGR